MKQVEDILNIAESIWQQEQETAENLMWYKEFEEFVTPLVREKFNIPRFEMQYFQMGMVGKNIKDFIGAEQVKYLENIKN